MLRPVFDLLMFATFSRVYIHLMNDVIEFLIEDVDDVVQAGLVLGPPMFKLCIVFLLVCECFELFEKHTRFTQRFRRIFVAKSSNENSKS